MTTFALYNIKGGVGKTAAAVNLSYLASREGSATLLIDLDPQGSASFYFRLRPAKKFTSKKLLRGGKNIEGRVKGTDFLNLDALPSSLSFRKMDVVLGKLKKSKTRLSKVLRPLEAEYGYVFLDSPPNITLVSENIFAASDFLLIPVIPTTLAVMTYNKLIRFLEKRKYADSKKVLPFFSMVEKRKKMHQEIMADLWRSDPSFLKTYIPYSADVEKMGISREPMAAKNRNSRAARAYADLWLEIKMRLEKGRR